MNVRNDREIWPSLFPKFRKFRFNSGMVHSLYYNLQFELRELLKRGNSLFGSTEQTGSIGVVTLNCAHLEYLYKGDWDGLLKRKEELMNYAKKVLKLREKS